MNEFFSLVQPVVKNNSCRTCTCYYIHTFPVYITTLQPVASVNKSERVHNFHFNCFYAVYNSYDQQYLCGFHCAASKSVCALRLQGFGQSTRYTSVSDGIIKKCQSRFLVFRVKLNSCHELQSQTTKVKLLQRVTVSVTTHTSIDNVHTLNLRHVR